MRKHGFEPYLSQFDQSLAGVNENLFRILDRSEYFLFVDFKRDKLNHKDNSQEFKQEKLKHKNNGQDYRGSLYSHQELAIACYLFMEENDPNSIGRRVLLFGQEGLERNGVLACAQGNIQLHEFSTHDELLEKLEKALEVVVNNESWQVDWKNGLRILPNVEYEPNVPRRECKGNYVGDAAFWHLFIENQHRSKLATGCRCYLSRFESGATVPPKVRERIEQKWGGVVFNQSVGIPAKRKRRVCAFFHDANKQGIQFHQFGIDTDSDEAAAGFKGPGEYELEYTVVSANFPPAVRTFKLTLNGQPDGIRLEAIYSR